MSNLLNLSNQVEQLVVKRLHNLETNLKKKGHKIRIIFTRVANCISITPRIVQSPNWT